VLYNGFQTETRVWQVARERFVTPPRFSQLRSHRESIHIRTQAQQWITQAKTAYSKGELTVALDLLARIRSLPDYVQTEPAEHLLEELRRCCARGAELNYESQHKGSIYAVKLSPDGTLALTGGTDGELTIWSLATGRLDSFETVSRCTVRSICVSEDQRVVIVASDSGIDIRDLHTRCHLQTLPGHSQGARAIALSADQRQLLSYGYDESLLLWELDWELEVRAPEDWDAGADSLLRIFLAMHILPDSSLPVEYVPDEQETRWAPIYRERFGWTEPDFQALLARLQQAGYGWLSPQGVRARLQDMTTAWRGLRLPE
jgi:hypothetical protein